VSLKIQRIIEDLSDTEVDIQILALTTIPRISSGTNVSKDELSALDELVHAAAQSENADVVFLARKALNCLGKFEAAPPQVAPPKEQPSAVPQEQATPVPAIEALAVLAEAPPEVAPVPDATPQVAPVPEKAEQPAAVSEKAEQPAAVSEKAEQPTAVLLTETDPRAIATILAGLAQDAEDPAVLEQVAPFLQHEDDRVRANGVEVFQKLGSVEHTRFLIPLLSDKSNRVRSNAVLALGKLGHPQTKYYLKQMLADDAVSMRESAAYALTQLNSLEVLDLVLQILEDPYEGIRMRAVEALRGYDMPEVVEALKRHASDADAAVRESVITILREKGVNIERLLSQQEAQAERSAEESLGSSLEASCAKQDDDEEDALFDKLDLTDENLFQSLVQTIGRQLRKKEQRAHLMRLLFKLGIQGYELCRRGTIKAVPVVVLYYEIVKCQEYLHKLSLQAREQTSEETLSIMKAGIRTYRQRVRDSFVKLGRLAIEESDGEKVQLPESKDLTTAKKLLAST